MRIKKRYENRWDAGVTNLGCTLLVEGTQKKTAKRGTGYTQIKQNKTDKSSTTDGGKQAHIGVV